MQHITPTLPTETLRAEAADRLRCLAAKRTTQVRPAQVSRAAQLKCASAPLNVAAAAHLRAGASPQAYV